MGKISSYKVLILFVLFSIIVRFFSFFPSVIDHDESTYLVMGMEILNGKILYKDIIDFKPPGIFFIFAFLIKLYHSLFFIRLVGAVVIGICAFLLFKIKARFTSNLYLRLFVGLAYILLLSADPLIRAEPYGLPINTEIFFSLFTLTAIYLLFHVQQKNLYSYFFIGTIGGIGFIIKYLAVFDFMAWFLFFFLLLISEKKDYLKSLQKTITIGLIFLAGFIIPFLLLHLYFYKVGIFDYFSYLTYIAPGKYLSGTTFIKQLGFILAIHQWPIAMLFFYLSIFVKNSNNQFKKERLFVIIWLLFTSVAVVSSGQQYNHYRIQSLAPLAFYLPNFLFEWKWLVNKYNRQKRLVAGFLYVIIISILTSAFYYQKYYKQHDNLKEIATYINSVKNEKETLYVCKNRAQILNFLTNMSTPSRIIHNSNLGNTKREAVLGINSKNECKYIYDQKPTFIIGEDLLCIEFLETEKSDYKLEKTLNGVKIFRRR